MTVIASSTTPSDVWSTNGRKQRMIPDEHTGELIPYQRTSAFASTLDTKDGLMPWYAWCALKGERELPGVAEQVRRSPSAPAGLLEELAVAGGSKSAASKGSARHEILAMALTGATLPDLPDDAHRELDSVLRLIDTLGEVTAVEAATVNDEYRTAGSCDLVMRDPTGTPIVCEFKTGKLVQVLSAAIQLIAHARARYWVDGQRAGWVAVTRPRLIVIHAPQNSAAPQLVELDPDKAKAWADVAVMARETRKAAGRK